MRKKFHEREKIDKHLKELEKNETKIYQREKKHYTKELKKVEEDFKKKILEKEDFSRLKKHHYRHNDDSDYKGIREIENLFDEINEDYYKPIKTKSDFNSNYIEYESRGDKDKKLSVKEYLFMILPYLRNMINNHKAPIKLKDPTGIIIEDDLFGEWKIQLTMQINFVSSLDPRKNCIMDSKSDNVEIIMGIKTDNIIEKLLKSFLKNYQKNLEEKMKDSNFVFESVDLLYYSLHKATLRRGKSYIKSSEWLRNKRGTINPQNYHDNKCFQYSTIAALNHQNIENHPERISNLKPFIDYYKWKEIEFPSHSKDWKKF